jgi:Tfp pilus assembly protein PilO
MSRKTISHDAIAVINRKRREIAIFIIITLVVFVLLVAFPIRMMIVSVVRINNEINQKRRIDNQLQQKIENMTALNTEYQEIKSEMKDLTLILPNNGDYSLFVANIEEIAKGNNFRLDSVGIATDITRRRIVSEDFEILVPITAMVHVSGRRIDLIKFFEDIENLPMYPTISSVSYKNEPNEEGLFLFSISVQIYGVNNQSIYFDI